MNVYAIEGLDRLGKSTLIENIQNELGYFEVMHFKKPKLLKFYEQNPKVWSQEQEYQAILGYQVASFTNSMHLANSGAKLIFDRWHLGECVYAPMYRKYNADYVFALEKQYQLNRNDKLKLILLVEDFKISRHFADDGESLGPIQKREEEQNLFLKAFEKSIIKNKKIISVTDPETGDFRDQLDILEEVLL